MVAVGKRVETMADYLDDLTGYQARMPRCEGAALDVAMVEQMRCRKCDGTVEYRPFVRYDRNGQLASYRAFAVCRNPACQLTEEF